MFGGTSRFLTFPENEGIGERGKAGSDMNGSTTSVIEGGKVVEPAIPVPCPAGDRAVDDGSPDEGKEHGGEETSAFESTTNHNLDSSNAEKELEESKEDCD